MLNVSRAMTVGFAGVLLTACNAKMDKKGQPNPTPPPIEQQRYYPPSGAYVPPGQQHNIPVQPIAADPYAAPAVAPVVSNYPHADFTPHAALDGLGEWIVIDGQRFWVPNLSQVQDREGWTPYQQGFWSYDQDRDWTWNSQEPWGAITDHYGLWRHHRNRGWIWMAFPDNRYEPHCVTWFDEGQHVGWYPYMAGYEAHYRRFNHSHGFDDGFWDGHRAVFSLRTNVFGFRLGITMVERAHITERNIRRRMIRDHGLIVRIAQQGHSDFHFRSGRVGRIPGGDRRRSHDFLQSWAPHLRAPTGRAREVVGPRGARIMQPHFDRDGDGRPDRRGGDRRDNRGDVRGDGRFESGRGQQPRRETGGDQGRRRDRRDQVTVTPTVTPVVTPTVTPAVTPPSTPAKAPAKDGDRKKDADRGQQRRSGDRDRLRTQVVDQSTAPASN